MSIARMMVVVSPHIGHMIMTMMMVTVTNHYVPSVKIGMIPTETIANMIAKRVIIGHYLIVDSTVSTNAYIDKHITSLQHHIKKELTTLYDSSRMNDIVAPVVVLNGMNYLDWHCPALSCSE